MYSSGSASFVFERTEPRDDRLSHGATILGGILWDTVVHFVLLLGVTAATYRQALVTSWEGQSVVATALVLTIVAIVLALPLLAVSPPRQNAARLLCYLPAFEAAAWMTWRAMNSSRSGLWAAVWLAAFGCLAVAVARVGTVAFWAQGRVR